MRLRNGFTQGGSICLVHCGISSGTNLYQSQFKQVVQDFSSLQSDLSSGNLSTAQQAYTSLTKDLASVRAD